MPLEEILLNPPARRPLPRDVTAFLVEARARTAEFFETSGSPPLGFVPSDFEEVYRILEVLRTTCGAAERFCEWGSGFAVIAGLASLLGYHAEGIELRPVLVREARRLLADFGLDVEIFEGSFVPDEYDSDACDVGGTVTVLSGAGANDEVETGVDDYDVIFAFPWPGEEEVYLDIFERFAATGAHFVAYLGGDEGVHVWRKT